LPFIVDLPQHVAAEIHETPRRAIDGRRLACRAIILRLEAPGLIDRLDVAEIALRARHAGGAFGALALLAAARGFRPDAHEARPEEGAGAGREARQVLVAEARLRELHVALERLAIDLVRFLQVAELQDVGIAEVDLLLVREILDQHAA